MSFSVSHGGARSKPGNKTLAKYGNLFSCLFCLLQSGTEKREGCCRIVLIAAGRETSVWLFELGQIVCVTVNTCCSEINIFSMCFFPDVDGLHPVKAQVLDRLFLFINAGLHNMTRKVTAWFLRLLSDCELFLNP